MTPEAWLFRNSSLATSDAPLRLAHPDRPSVDLLLLNRDSSPTLRRHLLLLQHGWPGGKAPWGQILVADLGSTDESHEIATDHGALWIPPENPRAASHEPAADGAGVSLALDASSADIVLVVPADLVRLDLSVLASLALVLVEHPEIALCQGASSSEGCRLSALGIRPFLAALCSPLSVMSDPASPLLALRRSIARELPIARTAGYEPALLVDLHTTKGLPALAQVLAGPMRWRNGDPRDGSSRGFRSHLALLEALRRGGHLSTPGEFGHLLPVPTDWTSTGPKIQTSLEIFPWSPAVPWRDSPAAGTDQGTI